MLGISVSVFLELGGRVKPHYSPIMCRSNAAVEDLGFSSSSKFKKIKELLKVLKRKHVI